MKKLMTMIGAAAAAFGLYADGLSNKIDFKDSYLEVGEALDVTKDDAGNEAEGATRGWYSATPEETGVAAEDAVYEKVLNLDNSSPLYRTVVGNDGTLVPQDIDDSGIFFDTTVKFTVGDATETPAIEDGAKLAIWVGGDEEAGCTNLYVTAGSIADQTITAANFTVALPADFDFEAWHRITIRTIMQAVQGQDVPGFVLFVDQTAYACADDDYATKIGSFTPSSAAKEFLDTSKLFLSLVAGTQDYSQQFAGVGFRGNGSLANVGITDYANAPEWARGAKVFALSWDEGVTGFTANGEVLSGLTDAGTTNLTITSGDTITVRGVAYAEDYMRGEWENGTTEDGVNGTFTWTVDAPAGTIGANKIAFKIGNKPYASFEDALADAVQASEPTTIALAASIDGWEGEQVIESADADVTLDLAGYTLTFEDFADVDILTVNAGKLTVITSAVGGKMVVANPDGSQFQGIFYAEGGDIIIGAAEGDEGATFEGYIGESLGTNGQIVKGKFDQENNPDEEAIKGFVIDPELDVVDLKDGYWTVQKTQEPETFEVMINEGTGTTLTVTDAEGNPVVDGESVAAGTELTITVEATDGYKDAKITVNETPFESGTTYTVENTDVAIASEATAINYAITYNDFGQWADGFVPPSSYTIESETFALPDAKDIEERAGGTFKNWTNELGEVVSDVKQGSKGDLVLYAWWETSGTEVPTWVPEGSKEDYKTYAETYKDIESDLETDEDKLNAFLLNVAPTKAALDEAKKAFKITSITFEDGVWKVTTVDGVNYNGTIKVEAFNNPGCKGDPVVKPEGDETELFYRAKLVPKEPVKD